MYFIQDSAKIVSTFADPSGIITNGERLLGCSNPGVWYTQRGVPASLGGPAYSFCSAVTSVDVKHAAPTPPLEQDGKSRAGSNAQRRGLSMRPSLTPSWTSHFAMATLKTSPILSRVRPEPARAARFHSPLIMMLDQSSVGAFATMPSKSAGKR